MSEVPPGTAELLFGMALLPSLEGLGYFENDFPSVKTLGYFQ
jgi:hypothetical protein